MDCDLDPETDYTPPSTPVPSADLHITSQMEAVDSQLDLEVQVMLYTHKIFAQLNMAELWVEKVWTVLLPPTIEQLDLH